MLISTTLRIFSPRRRGWPKCQAPQPTAKAATARTIKVNRRWRRRRHPPNHRAFQPGVPSSGAGVNGIMIAQRLIAAVNVYISSPYCCSWRGSDSWAPGDRLRRAPRPMQSTFPASFRIHCTETMAEAALPSLRRNRLAVTYPVATPLIIRWNCDSSAGRSSRWVSSIHDVRRSSKSV